MHVLYLRIIDHHVHDLFQIDLEKNGSDGSEPRVARPPKPTPERITMVLNLFWMWRRSPDLLVQLMQNDWANFAALWHICNDHNLRISGNFKKRAWFILQIKRWMDKNITDDELLTIPPSEPVKESVQTLSLAAVAAIASFLPLAGVTELDIEYTEKLIRALY
ncbi:hypothetical protein B0H17DRAFT_1144459 [Mycena rosella]|uniref:Uncharacterized protein n=1 Tax=Mycena rosella TaxID=1033263 RepID=A0AAD7CT66_MYCRO|nr:hypothetical protein B0H17DRAFT_1144459 [Mycena rosella]